MRALAPLLVLTALLLAACGGDPVSPAGPQPIELVIRFINESDESIRSVDVRCRIEEPGAEPRELSHNWQPVAAGARLNLVEHDTLQAGTVVQTWFAVLARWSEGETYERWRVWTTETDTMQTRDDARHVLLWPQGRWDLTEVSWPPGVVGVEVPATPDPGRR